MLSLGKAKLAGGTSIFFCYLQIADCICQVPFNRCTGHGHDDQNSLLYQADRICCRGVLTSVCMHVLTCPCRPVGIGQAAVLQTYVQLLTCSEGMIEIQHHELARRGIDGVSACEDFTKLLIKGYALGLQNLQDQSVAGS